MSPTDHLSPLSHQLLHTVRARVANHDQGTPRPSAPLNLSCLPQYQLIALGKVAAARRLDAADELTQPRGVIGECDGLRQVVERLVAVVAVRDDANAQLRDVAKEARDDVSDAIFDLSQAVGH